jgi:mannose-1-phosphate guanylyltransferase
MPSFVPIILSGGAGTRLWPVSREALPKPFIKLPDGESLLVKTLLGDPSKAKEKRGWTPKTTFAELVAEMVREDLKAAERDELVKKHGFKTMDYHE